MNAVVLSDVALREHGQNVSAPELRRFTPEFRVRTARALIAAGVPRIEVFSCVSPRVAPAMAADQLAEIAEGIGTSSPTELVTLVPNPRGFESFLALGLGPDGFGHTVGVFHSAVEAHNQANFGHAIDDNLAWIRDIAHQARQRDVPLAGYVSAAFGYRPAPGQPVLDVPHGRLRAFVEQQRELGVGAVTLSDLQGVRTPAETRDRLGRLLNDLGADAATFLGYHPHHADPAGGVALAEAAFDAGVRLFDGSLGAVGGCVTGAPGNAPTEGLLAMLARRGATTGIDGLALREASRAFDAGIR